MDAETLGGKKRCSKRAFSKQTIKRETPFRGGRKKQNQLKWPDAAMVGKKLSANPYRTIKLPYRTERGENRTRPREGSPQYPQKGSASREKKILDRAKRTGREATQEKVTLAREKRAKKDLN